MPEIRPVHACTTLRTLCWRVQALWHAVKRVIPDIEDRVHISRIGSPLTHERYLRRHKGSYGPGIIAGAGTFSGCKTPVPALLACGDSTFPGIGLPAVAASGAIAANTLVPFWDHMRLLDELGL
jgi:phytoene dehydrogenase-like protein